MLQSFQLRYPAKRRRKEIDAQGQWTGLKFPCVPSSLWGSVAALAVLLFGLALGTGLAGANGSARLVSTQTAGPYRVDFSILPAKPVVGSTHASILVRSLGSNEILTQATVRIASLSGPEGSTAFGPLEAGHLFSPQYYETAMPFDKPGPWQVRVDVHGSQGFESITVPLDVREPSMEINGILVAAIAVVVLALGVWTFDRIKGKKPRSAATDGDAPAS